MAQPVLEKGSTGSAVKKLQRALKARFYDPGSVDGIFGAATAKAVRQYQADHGLVVDGIVGPKTWAGLDPPTVKRGSKGDAVKRLQRLLRDFGYSPGAVDGDFGSKTEKAVKAFQTDFGLEVDGIAGSQTWAALGS